MEVGNIIGGHMKIKPEILDKYIAIDKRRYPVEDVPHFWDAVRRLVLDSEADISDLIKENGTKCFRDCNSREDVEGLCRYFANEIKKFENPEMHGIILFRIIKVLID